MGILITSIVAQRNLRPKRVRISEGDSLSIDYDAFSDLGHYESGGLVRRNAIRRSHLRARRLRDNAANFSSVGDSGGAGSGTEWGVTLRRVHANDDSSVIDDEDRVEPPRIREDDNRMRMNIAGMVPPRGPRRSRNESTQQDFDFSQEGPAQVSSEPSSVEHWEDEAVSIRRRLRERHNINIEVDESEGELGLRRAGTMNEFQEIQSGDFTAPMALIMTNDEDVRPGEITNNDDLVFQRRRRRHLERRRQRMNSNSSTRPSTGSWSFSGVPIGNLEREGSESDQVASNTVNNTVNNTGNRRSSASSYSTHANIDEYDALMARDQEPSLSWRRRAFGIYQNNRREDDSNSTLSSISEDDRRRRERNRHSIAMSFDGIDVEDLINEDGEISQEGYRYTGPRI